MGLIPPVFRGVTNKGYRVPSKIQCGPSAKLFLPHPAPRAMVKPSSQLAKADEAAAMVGVNSATQFKRRQKEIKKSKADGFYYMGLIPPVFRGVMNKGYKVPSKIQCGPSAKLLLPHPAPRAMVKPSSQLAKADEAAAMVCVSSATQFKRRQKEIKKSKADGF